MSTEIRVDIAVPAWMRDPAGALRKPLLEAAQRAMTNTLVKHFRALDRTEPNAKGWKRSHWWNRAAESVTSRIEGETAVAEVHQAGVRLHWKGGTVRPRSGHKFLAIPVDKSVYGIWPSEWRGKGTSPLFRIGKKAGSGGLLATRKGKGKNSKLQILWRLVEETRHEPDPDVVPAEDLRASVEKAARAVARALQKGGTP